MLWCIDPNRIFYFFSSNQEISGPTLSLLKKKKNHLNFLQVIWEVLDFCPSYCSAIVKWQDGNKTHSPKQPQVLTGCQLWRKANILLSPFPWETSEQVILILTVSFYFWKTDFPLAVFGLHSHISAGFTSAVTNAMNYCRVIWPGWDADSSSLGKKRQHCVGVLTFLDHRRQGHISRDSRKALSLSFCATAVHHSGFVCLPV